jgi:hypothetical protein
LFKADSVLIDEDEEKKKLLEQLYRRKNTTGQIVRMVNGIKVKMDQNILRRETLMNKNKK